MERKKNKSRILETTHQRIKGIESLASDLDLGNDKSV
jgi:hypothetical protein